MVAVADSADNSFAPCALPNAGNANTIPTTTRILINGNGQLYGAEKQ
jgi:hypothetical protein